MSDDHYHVGRQHGQAGERRYKFQDPHLQAEYDRGYNEAEQEWNTIQKAPPPSFDDTYGISPLIRKVIPGSGYRK
jgi:hypothetical protein